MNSIFDPIGYVKTEPIDDYLCGVHVDFPANALLYTVSEGSPTMHGGERAMRILHERMAKFHPGIDYKTVTHSDWRKAKFSQVN